MLEGVDPVDLQAELRYLLKRWDPIGIYDGATDYPPDEYDCMIGPLFTRLADGGNAAQISEFCGGTSPTTSGSTRPHTTPTASPTSWSPGTPTTTGPSNTVRI